MIKECKYLILGAGPSGLSLAHALLDQGCTLNEIIIIEKVTLPVKNVFLNCGLISS
jgi:cation diffusion facilitator CzcD-associated flavoprotein CzcO